MAQVWLRAEVSPSVGLGHLMRMVALAEAAPADRQLRLVVPPEPLALGVARRFGLDVVAVGDDLSTWVEDVEAGDVVVLDGYGLGAALLDAAAARGATTIRFDDFDGDDVVSDVVVNQSWAAARYPRAGAALLGPGFAQVRGELRRRRAERTPGRRCLVATFGGSDPTALGRRLVEALDGARPFERVVLLAGPGSDRSRLSVPPWLEIIVDPPDVGAVFDEADAVVAAAGSTTWELLCMGLPVGLVAAVPNQAHVLETAVDAGAALATAADGSEFRALAEDLAEPDHQARLSAAALALVDGRGTDRVMAAALG